MKKISLEQKISELTSFVMMQQYEIAKLKKTIAIYDNWFMEQMSSNSMHEMVNTNQKEKS